MKAKYQILVVCLIFLVIALAGRTTGPAKIAHEIQTPKLRQLAKLQPGKKPIAIKQVERIDWNNAGYLAVVVKQYAPIGYLDDSEETRTIPAQSLLIFRRYRNQTKLLEKIGPHFYLSIRDEERFLSLGNNFEGLPQNGFSDRNGNGLPDLGIGFNHGGGNCSDCGSFMVVELTANRGVRDITPKTNLNPQGTIDVNHDGKLEVIATRFYDGDFGSEGHAGSPYESRIYEWQGNAYKDASKKSSAYYDDQIAELRKIIKGTYRQPFVSYGVSPVLVQMFFDYEAMGKADKGWSEVLSLGDFEHWNIRNSSADEIAKYERVRDRLRKRVNKP